MSKLEALTEKIVREVLGEGLSDVYAKMLADQVMEIVHQERTGMPQPYGYTRERSLVGRCRRACGGYLPGGVLVHHVLQRFGKKASSGLVERNGKLWICQTREWWCYELSLTRHEYDAALSAAKGSKLLEVDHAKITTKGLPMTHVRPTDYALLLRASLIASVKHAKWAKMVSLEHQGVTVGS